MDKLDEKLTAVFDGRVVRKDLLHRIKKGTNVPTFVLEFLLARYCASNEPAEIQAGMEAVIATLQDNYVRPEEANAAQSKVATNGKYRFIDKIHVRYVEKEKRHWASLENFNSRRIAISEKFYRDNDRLLEGGIWAEVTVAYNEFDDDNHAFLIDDLRPIQLSRFDYTRFGEGRKEFTRDEWLNVILRSVGLEPAKLNHRLKFHYIARLASLAEANYNFIELGPRGTGKSYFFSEFSPYSTLISGGQSTKAVLFYNNARKRMGLVGFWDTVAFDEVAGIRIKDPDTIQIMKDYMANGRFSRGVEVIADASMAFVGNIDHSIEQLVRSSDHDLFLPLPKEFDLAVMDRFACYLPGWEIPKNTTAYLTNNYGFITDYLAEAFHYQLKHVNKYEEVSSRVNLGKSIEGRDEIGIKKTLCAFLKILHPIDKPTDEEFDEYIAYAVEARRRVKEQMNKRKPDDEFANIDLSFFNAEGKEIIVSCPESKEADATQDPIRKNLDPEKDKDSVPGNEKEQNGIKKTGENGTANQSQMKTEIEKNEAESAHQLEERHFTIFYDDTGHNYESIMGPYFKGAKEIIIEDPYIRLSHQIQNFIRLCETIVKLSTIRKIVLITSFDEKTNISEMRDSLDDLKQSLLEIDIVLDIKIDPNMHDREIRLDNGWTIKIGRGLDFYQKPNSWFEVGVNDLSLRKCLETKVDIFKK
ncbi:MAG: BREX system Lon protease-like protein BrxL [Desulfobacula sp.]|uniref:BREX system Lon protease-like protein BrxL n=1 Tax=Desulfobacula sp. TaxID=2593537 RepID=UPI0025B9CC68|nr:BREX system Lon protease-like protein BrxL [Desulfobacula sp.]MCD4722906.1 BREX system Lon protease-like protein BrxL [Desulfobacula sp.]